MSKDVTVYNQIRTDRKFLYDQDDSKHLIDRVYLRYSHLNKKSGKLEFTWKGDSVTKASYSMEVYATLTDIDQVMLLSADGEYIRLYLDLEFIRKLRTNRRTELIVKLRKKKLALVQAIGDVVVLRKA